jgi:hypothetical protein
MATVCFVSYEIAPTTMGGCGVFVRRASEALLADGHEVVLVLDLPREEFARFTRDELPRLGAGRQCRAYHVESLDTGAPARRADAACVYVERTLRFERVLRHLDEVEQVDVIEFFD